MNNTVDRITENYKRVSQQVAEATQAAGREPSEVTIVGVSKYVDADTTKMLVAAGCEILGESRPQSLWDKAEELKSTHCQWHMIGHLQRNKLRRTLPLVSLIHSVDSMRLAEAISATAKELGRTAQGLLEVNISGDASKHGFSPEEIAQLLEPVAQLQGLQIVGLMAMSGLDSSSQQARCEFAKVRMLREQLTTGGLPSNLHLDHLSMGMSGDFREAIAEGATLVRIGSALFEGII